MSKPILIDLFSGCGGFGLGGELSGFHTAVAVDLDPTLQSAYKINFPNTKAIQGDIGKMDKDTWRLILRDNPTIDGVIGGPPCQGYSRMGHNDIKDPRRSLLYHFYRTVNIIQPKFFVMENVEGLMDTRNRNELDQAIDTVDSKYTVLEPIIVDASHFGAPTKRKRVLVIGFDPDQVDHINTSDFLSERIYTSVENAIGDLPAPIKQNKDKKNYGWAKYRTDNELSDYAKIMRTQAPAALGWSKAINQLKLGKTSGHFDTIHSEIVAKRYAGLVQGETDKVSRAKKLSWEGLCPTLRAGTGSDKGSHQAVRPIHPDEGRVITVREAARLQGFPDWFCFHPTKWHSFRMIGNSVSPLVSKRILASIAQKIGSNKIKKSA